MPTIDEWALTKALLKLVAVWVAFAVILPVPWASAMHLIKSVVNSHFPVNQSTDSLEKLKADLALENQTADLFGEKETLEGSKKQKLEG